VKHAGAETTFKRKNPAANNGFCYAELLRRAGEASHLHRADEDRHVIEDAHERTIFRNEATEVKSSAVETTTPIPINPSITGAMSANAVAYVPTVLRRRPRN
jgi:hypothetical protein